VLTRPWSTTRRRVSIALTNTGPDMVRSIPGFSDPHPTGAAIGRRGQVRIPSLRTLNHGAHGRDHLGLARQPDRPGANDSR
jgi:hypothetical protein